MLVEQTWSYPTRPGVGPGAGGADLVWVQVLVEQTWFYPTRPHVGPGVGGADLVLSY